MRTKRLFSTYIHLYCLTLFFFFFLVVYLERNYLLFCFVLLRCLFSLVFAFNCTRIYICVCLSVVCSSLLLLLLLFCIKSTQLLLRVNRSFIYIGHYKSFFFFVYHKEYRSTKNLCYPNLFFYQPLLLSLSRKSTIIHCPFPFTNLGFLVLTITSSSTERLNFRALHKIKFYVFSDKTTDSSFLGFLFPFVI